MHSIALMRPKCYHYSIQVTVYIGKIIQTRRSQYTHCNISQNGVSKCTGLHLGAYLFQKISRGYAPRPPQKACGLRPLRNSSPNDKSQIEPCQSSHNPASNGPQRINLKVCFFVTDAQKQQMLQKFPYSQSVLMRRSYYTTVE